MTNPHAVADASRERPSGLEPPRELPTRPSTRRGRVSCVRGRPDRAFCGSSRTYRAHLAVRLFSRAIPARSGETGSPCGGSRPAFTWVRERDLGLGSIAWGGSRVASMRKRRRRRRSRPRSCRRASVSVGTARTLGPRPAAWRPTQISVLRRAVTSTATVLDRIGRPSRL